MSKFKEVLKELRCDKKISQKELAAILDTTNSSISDWEQGRAEPNIDTIIKICKYFEVSADFLLGLED